MPPSDRSAREHPFTPRRTEPDGSWWIGDVVHGNTHARSRPRIPARHRSNRAWRWAR